MISPASKTFKTQQPEALPALKSTVINSGQKKREEADEERLSEKEGVGELEDSFQKGKIEAEQDNNDDLMYGEESHQFSDEM